MTMKEFLYDIFLIIKMLFKTTIEVSNLDDFVKNVKTAVLLNIDIKTAAKITATIAVIGIACKIIKFFKKGHKYRKNRNRRRYY